MAQALTPEQIEIIKGMAGKRGTATRFTAGGRGFNPLTGELGRKGANVIYAQVYWDLSREQAKLIAEFTGSNMVFEDANPEQAAQDAIKAEQEAQHLATVAGSGASCRCYLHR